MKKYYVEQKGIVNRVYETDLPLKELCRQALSYCRHGYRLNARVNFRVYDNDTYECLFSLYTVKSSVFEVCRIIRFNACAKYGDLTIRHVEQI